MRVFSYALQLALCLTSAEAIAPIQRSGVPKPKNNGLPAGIHLAHFDQLIDHTNPKLGTFPQRYWWSDQYYAGPGSPIVFFTPGEENAAPYIGYCTNATLNGLVAKKIGAAAIVLEHRYWGTSSPFDDLTTANMQYLTLENAIADLNYFAANVKLPFAKAPSNARDVPWVLIGGSYSGALTAWTFGVAPGTIWAGLATSAPVQAISNFWQYYVPIQQGMPQNCSKDVSLVINHLDNVMEHGTQKEIIAIKTQFGLEAVEHNDDFMSALINGPAMWQSSYPAYPSEFFQWCDYVENAVNTTDIPGADGVGLTKALNGYAAWMKEQLIPDYCADYYDFHGKYNVECFDSYNKDNPIFTNTSLLNPADRQWEWMLCNQPFGYWQTGEPTSRSTLASRLVNVEYYTRQCALYFPTGPQGQTYGIAKGATEAEVNKYTAGWNNDKTTRMIYTNGQFDPWRSASTSSQFRPGGPLQSTSRVPVLLIPGGHHCWDLLTNSGTDDPAVLAIQEQEIEQLAKWVDEFPQHHWSA